MEIGIDLRITSHQTHYTQFVETLVRGIIQSYPDDTFFLYVHKQLPWVAPNIVQEVIQHSYELKSIAGKHSHDMTYFFDDEVPLFYKGPYTIFLENLKDYHYPARKHFLQKYWDNIMFHKSLRNADKIVCFDTGTKSEINDELNISEDKIEVIRGFFPLNEHIKNDIVIDIKKQMNMSGDFLIYPGTAGTNKNLDRLLKSLAHINLSHDLSLIIFDEQMSKDLSLRKILLKYNIANKVHFLGYIKEEEKYNYYNQSKGCVYASIHESFPFDLSEAILFDTPIVASNLSAIQRVMGINTLYFNPILSNSISKAIITFIDSPKPIPNYDFLRQTYTLGNTLADLKKII